MISIDVPFSRVLVAVLGLTACPVLAWSKPPPGDTVIAAVSFDFSTHARHAPGSDNWPITWADDGHQYSSWGDGGGFNGTNKDCRVSLGVARIEGDKDNYVGRNRWGCNRDSKQCKSAGPKPRCAAEFPAAFKGKSYGMLSVDHDRDGKSTLWMWNMVEGSYFRRSELYSSHDHGATWQSAGWRFSEPDCAFAVPTFVNMGRDYAANSDGFIYVYAPDGRCDVSSSPPGGMADGADLARVLIPEIGNRAAYEFFAGTAPSGQPVWSRDISRRKKAFWYGQDRDRHADHDRIFWAISVTYNPGLEVYMLFNRPVPNAGVSAGRTDLDLWESPNPWGPWEQVESWTDWLPGATIVWWFPAPKWFSSDGTKMVVVFGGVGQYDSWNTVEATLTVRPTASVDASQVSLSPLRSPWHNALRPGHAVFAHPGTPAN